MQVLLPLNVEEERARLEIAPFGLNREVCHLRELAVVDVVHVHVEGHGQHCCRAQLAFAEAQLQVLHLPVESQRTERSAIHVERSRHDRSYDLYVLAASKFETIKMLVVAIHLGHRDVIEMLQVFDSGVMLFFQLIKV